MSESVKTIEKEKKRYIIEDKVNENINRYLFYLVYHLCRRKEKGTKKIVAVAS